MTDSKDDPRLPDTFCSVESLGIPPYLEGGALDAAHQDAGNPEVESQNVESMLPEIYGQLRELAGRQFASERGSTLQPTALVHEAFLRLIEQRGLTWRSRTHFFAIAAREVRRVLVDQWRRKTALRREGVGRRQPLEAAASVASDSGEGLSMTDLLALDEALTVLAENHKRPARVAEMAFFAGLTQQEIAELMGLSRKTIASDWSFARSFLIRELER